MSESIWKEDPIDEFKKFQEMYPELSKEFIDLVHRTLYESKLERKIQELIIIVLLIKFESGFKFHLREAMRYGATKEEVLGVILLTLPYCDIGTFLTALTWGKDEGFFSNSQ